MWRFYFSVFSVDLVSQYAPALTPAAAKRMKFVAVKVRPYSTQTFSPFTDDC